MQISDITSFIEKFILDVVGVVLPGFLLISGLWVAFDFSVPNSVSCNGLSLGNVSATILLIGLSYILGHALGALSEKLVEPLYFAFSSQFRKIFKPMLKRYALVDDIMSGFFPDESPKYENLRKKLAMAEDVQAFSIAAKKKYDSLSGKVDENNFHAYRSIALAISDKSTQLTYKFMFVSLSCASCASASSIIGIAYFTRMVVLYGANESHFSATLAWLLLLVFFIPLLLFTRRYEFYRRALSCPFSAALISIEEGAKPRS